MASPSVYSKSPYAKTFWSAASKVENDKGDFNTLTPNEIHNWNTDTNARSGLLHPKKINISKKPVDRGNRQRVYHDEDGRLQYGRKQRITRSKKPVTKKPIRKVAKKFTRKCKK
jgi:hypothetical protein